MSLHHPRKISFLMMVLLILYAGCQREQAKIVKPAPKDVPSHFFNSIGMKMKLIPSGTFIMGSDDDWGFWGRNAGKVNGPAHEVSVSAFYMAAFEVNKGQFRTFVNETGKGRKLPELNPENVTRETNWSYFLAPGDLYPMYSVDWKLAKSFAAWLSEKENLSYRLPTEAEWEYACRASTTTKRYWGNDWDPYRAMSYDVAGSLGKAPYPATLCVPGSYASNPWGLFDMLGNTMEWTSDWYKEEYYKESPKIDPKGPAWGTKKVRRGGDYHTRKFGVICEYRGASASRSENRGGIRLVMEVNDKFIASEYVKNRNDNKPSQAPTESNEADTLKIDIAPGTFIELVPIQAGSFTMGSPETERYRSPFEGPQAQIVLSEDFYMGKYEITQAQYQAIMQENPSDYKGKELPVHNISYHDAVEFCGKVTEREKAEGRLLGPLVFRLPTEAEWEYACRAGTKTAYWFGEMVENLVHYAWFDCTDGPKAIGLKQPNPWGLFDLYGNVWEWMHNSMWTYNGKNSINPVYMQPPLSGVACRGGGWNFTAHRCRSAARYALSAAERYEFTGFRIVRAKEFDLLRQEQVERERKTGKGN